MLQVYKHRGAKGWTVSRHIHTWGSGPIVLVQCLEIETFVRCSTSQSDTSLSVDATYTTCHITQSLRLSSLYVPDVINYRSQWKQENQDTTYSVSVGLWGLLLDKSLAKQSFSRFHHQLIQILARKHTLDRMTFFQRRTKRVKHTEQSQNINKGFPQPSSVTG